MTLSAHFQPRKWHRGSASDGPVFGMQIVSDYEHAEALLEALPKSETLYDP